MQYTNKELELLGKQVAKGNYITRSTFLLSCLLALLLGICGGRYLVPFSGGSGESAESKRPLGEDSSLAAGINPKQQLRDSIRLHEEEIRNNPNDADAFEHLGNLYFDLGEPQKSVEAYNKALALKPDNTSVLVDCGVMYRDLKQFDKALEYFKRALIINPRHEFALFNSGVVLFHDLDRKEEGRDYWQALVKVNPKAKTRDGELVSDMLLKH